MDTLKKYVKAQGNNKKMVRSKYIIIPKVNDTVEDVNKWLDETQKIGIQQVIIDFEADWFERNKTNIPSYIDDLYNYIVSTVKQRGLDIQFYGVANQYRTIKGKDLDIKIGLHQGE